MPRETDLAYAAGIIDGEGCITILRQKEKYKYRYRLFIVVANNNEEVVRHLHTTFQCGAVHLMRRSNPQYGDAWQWQVSGADAYGFLLQIQSFLIVKRRDCALGIEFYSLPPNDYSRKIVPVADAERQRLFLAIREGRFKHRQSQSDKTEMLK